MYITITIIKHTSISSIAVPVYRLHFVFIAAGLGGLFPFLRMLHVVKKMIHYCTFNSSSRDLSERFWSFEDVGNAVLLRLMWSWYRDLRKSAKRKVPKRTAAMKGAPTFKNGLST